MVLLRELCAMHDSQLPPEKSFILIYLAFWQISYNTVRFLEAVYPCIHVVAMMPQILQWCVLVLEFPVIFKYSRHLLVLYGLVLVRQLLHYTCNYLLLPLLINLWWCNVWSYFCSLVTDLLLSGTDPFSVIIFSIADDIVEKCLLDVCSELEDINNDIVNHVYRSEFAMVPANEQQP